METTQAFSQTIDAAAEGVADTNGFSGPDRRRPGRPQEISPHLVALLRADERQTLPPMTAEVNRAAIGLGAAALLSVPLWIMLGVIAWALLG